MKNCIKLSGHALILSLSLTLILMGSNVTMELAFAQSPAMPISPPANNAPVAVDKAKAEYDPTQPLIAPGPNAKVEAKEPLKELEKDLRKDSQNDSLKEATKESAKAAEKKSANDDGVPAPVKNTPKRSVNGAPSNASGATTTKKKKKKKSKS